MDWSTLLTPTRLGRPATGPGNDTLRTEFFKDWDRIVFCSAFRRLQDKTQVQPLAKTDYVRTRLTHSLEVASVGRSLGMLAGQAITEARPELSAIIGPQDVGAIVAAACLMHDVGNPPFGHAGEAAVQAYFAERGAVWLEGLSPAQQADLLHFEGNAQGFRTVARLQHPDQAGGLQLTLPTLGAFSKYPRGACVPAAAASGASGKKFGFMDSEALLFAEMADALGLKPKVPGGQRLAARAPCGEREPTACPGGGDPAEGQGREQGRACAWHRHPLAFLVEAADDICYGVIDLEDGVKSGHIHLQELVELHRPFAGEAALRRADSLRDPQNRAELLRAVTIGALVQRASEAFAQRSDALLNAEFDQPLADVMRNAHDFGAFKALARERLYNERSKAELQVAGFEIIGDLLHTFCDAVETLAQPSPRGKVKAELVLRLLPRGAELPLEPSRYQRLLAVTDFIAGMTDRYAVDMHRRLRGVDL